MFNTFAHLWRDTEWDGWFGLKSRSSSTTLLKPASSGADPRRSWTQPGPDLAVLVYACAKRKWRFKSLPSRELSPAVDKMEISWRGFYSACQLEMHSTAHTSNLEICSMFFSVISSSAGWGGFALYCFPPAVALGIISREVKFQVKPNCWSKTGILCKH